MADDHLLIRLSPPAPPPEPSLMKKNALGLLALGVSLISLLFSGLQWWSARESMKLQQLSQGPYLEITKEEFANPTNLLATVHNIGKTPALNPTCQFDVFMGKTYMPNSPFKKVPSGYGSPGKALMPNIPVGRETQMNVGNLPFTAALLKEQAGYDPTMDVEFRGLITYFDEIWNPYYLRYCYQARGVYGSALPVASTCVHMTDFGNFTSRIPTP